MRLKLIFFLVIFASFACAKRSGGRSRGSSGSSKSFWTRRSSSKGDSPKPESKPSAPQEPAIQKQTSSVQQNARPVGWDVGDTKKQVNPSQAGVQPNAPTHPLSYQQNAPVHPPSYQQSAPVHPPGYQQNAYPPSYQQSAPVYPPGYQQGAYPPSYQQGGHPAYPPSYQQSGGGYPVHPPSYQQSAYPQQHYPGYGGYGGGYGGYPQQQPGMGSFLGGKNHGFGGGGYGNYASYGYGLKKSGGFFGKHAFRNVLGGLFVWYMVSGLVSRPYKVYNYYNQPREEREEIKLPANMLTLCNENATNICVPGTSGICTQDGKILCVTTMATAGPCNDRPGELCVTSTIPCIDANDPLCKNKTIVDNKATVDLPCFTNMTLEAGAAQNATLPGLPPDQGTNKYCVTTMAVPDPDLPIENVQSLETTPSTNSTSTSTSTETFNSTILNKQ